MYYESLMEKLLDENNDEIIELQAEGGDNVKFEQVAVVNYEGNPYAILRPLSMREDQVAIFKLNPEDEDAIEVVVDEKIADDVLAVFQEEIDNYSEEDEEENHGGGNNNAK